jgi:hypothetical protein
VVGIDPDHQLSSDTSETLAYSVRLSGHVECPSFEFVKGLEELLYQLYFSREGWAKADHLNESLNIPSSFFGSSNSL